MSEDEKLTAEPLTAEEEERARRSWFSRRNEDGPLSMLLGCFVRSLFATLDAERAKVVALSSRATAAEAEADKVRDLIEFWFSNWGAYKSERWEEISGDQPFSPDAMLAIIRAALAKEKPSELVTYPLEKAMQDAMRKAWPGRETPTIAEIRAGLLAVALDLYERGLREAAELVKGYDYTFGAANDAAAKIIDRFRTGTDKDAAPTCDVAEFALQDASGHIAAAILSKLRAPT